MKSISSRRAGVTIASFLFLITVMTLQPSYTKSGGPAEAEKFVTDAEERLRKLSITTSRADWIKSTYITDDTEAISAEANNELIAVTTQLAEQSRAFDGLTLSPEVARKIKLLKLSLTPPAPKNEAERDELTKIAASMEGDYGKGKYCPNGENGKCLSLGDMEEIMGNSRDPEELKRIWAGWHQGSAPYSQDYTRY